MRFLAAPVFVLLAALLAPSGTPAPADDDLHLRLIRSVPAADTTVTASPSALHFFFSEAPDSKGSSVTIADGAGKAGALGKPAPDAKDPKLFVVPVPEPLASGAWKVSWRVLAKDGHVVRGDFAFTVAPAR
ncbi:MAG: copper resistance protein CopC [Gemmatimonadetes bacterium]|nr:copper resistance protein CopC [Gemmatimonadota bacterium]